MQNTQFTHSNRQVINYKELFKYQNLPVLQNVLNSQDFNVNDYVSAYEDGSTKVTLLHLAVKYDWKVGAQLLLAKGANVDLKAYSDTRAGGGSPVDWARGAGREDWALFLEQGRSMQQAAQSASRLGR